MASTGWWKKMPAAPQPNDGKQNQRRSRRVAQSIRVKISSQSPDGKVLEREAETLVVGRYGARIHTDLPLQLGSSIKLTVPSTGGQADAVVTWVSEESPFEFGVELKQASNIWGVTLVPSSADSSPAQ
jgi:PilZ domain